MVKIRSMTSNRRDLLLAAGAVAMSAAAEAADTKPNVKPTSDAPLDSERFRRAVTSGDLATVTSMLDRDPALCYARDANGVSVYTLACLASRAKIAEELVRRGVVLDIFEATVSGNSQRATELAKDDPGIAHHRLPDGRTPLHLATEAGKAEMVVFQSMRGADLSAGPESPLLAAVNYPDREIATEMSRFLLMNASNPNASRRDGKTALQLASARRYDDLVEMLIHRGADASTISNAPKVERVYYGRRYTQDLNGNPVKLEENYGIPQELINQFASVAHFDFEKVKKLQKLCPMLVMAKATWDEMAIEAAAHMGLAPMAQFLADLGAPVSTCTATLLGSTDLVKKLVTEDAACVRERGAHDIAILAYTAYATQQVEIAEILLRAGADVHSRSLGQTILHIVAGKGHVELAQLLIDHGADINATTKVKGAMLTPLAFAIQTKQVKMAEFLKDRGGRA